PLGRRDGGDLRLSRGEQTGRRHVRRDRPALRTSRRGRGGTDARPGQRDQDPRSGARPIEKTVIPAQAGIHPLTVSTGAKWIPAFAGMTIFKGGYQINTPFIPPSG